MCILELCLQKERSHSTASGNGKGWNPPIISLDGIQTWLKLRTKVQRVALFVEGACRCCPLRRALH